MTELNTATNLPLPHHHQHQNQSSSRLSTRFREYYLTEYCAEKEVQRLVTVQSMCGKRTQEENDEENSKTEIISGDQNKIENSPKSPSLVIKPSSRWLLWSSYFGFWTHLGSGPFYIILLCLFAWTGHPLFAAYLCISLSFTLYTTDVIKDTLSLPRPPSPPVLKGGQASHALEYGFPSTHTACACVLAHIIARFFLEHLGFAMNEIFLTGDHRDVPTMRKTTTSSSSTSDNDNHHQQLQTFLILLIAIVFVSHVAISRMYLGLHWFGDILGGLFVYALWAISDYLVLRNLVTFVLSHVPLMTQFGTSMMIATTSNNEHGLDSSGSSSFFLVVVTLLLHIVAPLVWILTPLIVGVWFIEIHATPRDACPCFEDSCRFVGADVGLWIGSWTTILSYYLSSLLAISSESMTTTTATTTVAPSSSDTNNNKSPISMSNIFVKSDFSYYSYHHGSSLIHNHQEQIPSFTLAGLHSTFGFIFMYLVGIVLLILAQEISVKYILPPILRPVLKFISGSNFALMNSSSPFVKKSYMFLVWFCGTFIFLRGSVAPLSAKKGKSSNKGGGGGEQSSGPSVFTKIVSLFGGENSNTNTYDESNASVTTSREKPNEETTVVTVIKNDKNNSSKNSATAEQEEQDEEALLESSLRMINNITPPLNSENKEVSAANNNNNNNNDQQTSSPSKEDTAKVMMSNNSSNSNSSGNESNAVVAWSLKCHTHWEEDNIQAKFLSYVVLGFCASFVWPQYLLPGLVSTWIDMQTMW